jgi:hypothetical protein
MKRTHRDLLLLNFVITPQDTDDWFYSTWDALRRHLTRAELVRLVRAVRMGERYIVLANERLHSVQWSY